MTFSYFPNHHRTRRISGRWKPFFSFIFFIFSDSWLFLFSLLFSLLLFLPSRVPRIWTHRCLWLTVDVCSCLLSAGVEYCLWVFSAVYGRLYMSVGVESCLRVTTAISRLRMLSADICCCLQATVHVCRGRCFSAGISNCLQLSMFVCGYLQLSVGVKIRLRVSRGRLQLSTGVCTCLQVPRFVNGFLQPSARARV